MDAIVSSNYLAYEDVYDLSVKEGDREITVGASMREEGRMRFCYYNIKAWEYPFHEDVFTDEDRARLATCISDHYTAQGWHVEIDRRRFCPRCHEKLAGSDHQDWPGGTCDFCGRDVDRFGDIPVIDFTRELPTPEAGFVKRLKNISRRFLNRDYGPPPPPDLAHQPALPDENIREIIYSDSNCERAIITTNGIGTFKVYVQWWDTSDWSADHRAYWYGCDRSGYTHNLKSARRLASEALRSVAHHDS